MVKYNEYKDSGIEWLGDIPKHWKSCCVRSFVQEYVEKNKPEKTRELLALSYALGVTLYRDKQYNMDRVKEDYEEYKIVHENVLVVSPNDIIKGSAFVSHYYGCISPMYLTFKSHFEDPTYVLYLSYLLRTKQAGRTFFSMAKGLIGGILDNGKYVTRRMSVSRSDILAFKVVMPPIEEQQSIVAYLDRKCAQIDRMVEGKKRSLLLCKEAIDSLIFNQIDKVTAWGTCFPENWNLVTGRGLFDEIKITGLSDERFLAVTQDNGLIYKDVDNVNYVTATNKETQKLICPGQFVISLRSFEGGIEYSDKRGLISPAYVVIKLKDCYDTPAMRKYYRFLFKSKPFVRRLNTISDSMRDGKSIKFNDIKNFTFPIPTEKELNTIELYVDTYDKMKSAYSKEEALLYEYKQRLISDVVTGQIKVC